LSILSSIPSFESTHGDLGYGKKSDQFRPKHQQP